MHRVPMTRLLAAVAAAGAWLLVTPASMAVDAVKNFYSGNTVRLLIGYSPGGGYDAYGRLLARHISGHIPGAPTIVAQNMPGAGSLKMTNHLYRVAKSDGTVFGIFNRGAAMEPLLGTEQARYDPTKFTWIGSLNKEVAVCYAWHDAPVQTWKQLEDRSITMGATSPGNSTHLYPKLLNELLDANMEIVAGYPGSKQITLAIERGEVGGRCGSWSSLKSKHGDWVADGKVNVLVQLALSKHPGLPEVPLVMDLTESNEQRKILRFLLARQEMGRPFAAPPSVPEARADALRQAFTEAANDPELRADARRAKLEINPITGKEVRQLVNELYDLEDSLVDKARSAIGR